MIRLSAQVQRELLSIIEKARTEFNRAQSRRPQAQRDQLAPFDRRQALLDFAGIIDRLPHMSEYTRSRPGRGRKQKPIRTLAELAAEVYFHHTGRGPGSAQHESKKLGGLYPQFVAALAKAGDVPHDTAKLPALCNEVRKALSLQAGIARTRLRSRDGYAEREGARSRTLASHVVGYEDMEGNPVDDPADGFAVLGGYEPARPFVSARRRYRQFLRGRR